VQKSIIEANPNSEIIISIVWIKRLEGDSEEVAKLASEKFVKDSRVNHFFDPEQRVGSAITESLGVKAEASAWDIYLFFKPGKEWKELPPIPNEYVHQMSQNEWADPSKFFSGKALEDELCKLMENIDKSV